jgi:hypothetical protein
MRSRRQVAVLPRYLGLAAFTGLTLLSVGFCQRCLGSEAWPRKCHVSGRGAAKRWKYRCTS